MAWCVGVFAALPSFTLQCWHASSARLSTIRSEFRMSRCLCTVEAASNSNEWNTFLSWSGEVDHAGMKDRAVVCQFCKSSGLCHRCPVGLDSARTRFEFFKWRFYCHLDHPGHFERKFLQSTNGKRQKVAVAQVKLRVLQCDTRQSEIFCIGRVNFWKLNRSCGSTNRIVCISEEILLLCFFYATDLES